MRPVLINQLYLDLPCKIGYRYGPMLHSFLITSEPKIETNALIFAATCMFTMHSRPPQCSIMHSAVLSPLTLCNAAATAQNMKIFE